MSIVNVTEATTREMDTFRLVQGMRDDGWRVGVHNDYHVYEPSDVAGAAPVRVTMTFWLFTHPSGVFVSADGETDYDAVRECATKKESLG